MSLTVPSASLACVLCAGNGVDVDEDCPCCRGAGDVALADLDVDRLALFRGVPGCDAECARRGYVAWAVDCCGDTMPCTAEDLANGCVFVARIGAGPGVRRSSAPPSAPQIPVSTTHRVA